MSRFHQGTATDHVRPHTNVDHRETGPDLALAASGAWIALAEFHTKPDRQHAAIAAAETRIELFQRERHVTSALVMASNDGHRVVALLWIGGHDDFRSLQSAWDQHQQHLAHTDKAASWKMWLCRCTATSGDPTFEVGGPEVVTFENLSNGDHTLPDDDTTVGGALLSAETDGGAFRLMRRTRSVGDEPHYKIVRTWDDTAESRP